MQQQVTQRDPELQGLRCIAFLLVYVFHLCVVDDSLQVALGSWTGIQVDNILPHGNIGVDVFFVLSGFFIGKHIKKRLDAGTFSFWEFMGRRTRRVIPTQLVVAWAVLLVTFVLGKNIWLVLDVLKYGPFANHYFSRHINYFEADVIYRPLLHYWSLAVEEQFYLLIPIVMMVAHPQGAAPILELMRTVKRSLRLRIVPSRVSSSVRGGIDFTLRICGKLTLLPTLIVLALVSFFAKVSFVWLLEDENAAYYLLPSCAWILLTGIILGLFQTRSISQPYSFLLGTGGLFVIGYSAVTDITIGGCSLPEGFRTLPPVAATVVLIGWGRQSFVVRRCLSWKCFVQLGDLSYALYAWHWPILCFGKFIFPEKLLLVTATAACLILSSISYRLVEQRLRYKERMTRTIVVAALLTVLVSWGLLRFRPNPHICRLCEFNNSVKIEDIKNDVVTELGNLDQAKISLLVWGDSHAMTFCQAVNQWLLDHDQRGVAITYPSTAPVFDYVKDVKYGLQEDGPEWSEEVLRYCLRNRIPRVAIACYWDAEVSAKVPAAVERFAREGIEVWVVEDVPKLGVNPRTLSSSEVQNIRLSVADGNAVPQPDENDVIAAGGSFMSPRKFLMSDDGTEYRVWFRKDWKTLVLLYRDGHHVTIDGAMRSYYPMLNESWGRAPQGTVND
ncbi:MAG: acyltransferase family protein [Planctomycetota bacterium]